MLKQSLLKKYLLGLTLSAVLLRKALFWKMLGVELNVHSIVCKYQDAKAYLEELLYVCVRNTMQQ